MPACRSTKSERTRESLSPSSTPPSDSPTSGVNSCSKEAKMDAENEKEKKSASIEDDKQPIKRKRQSQSCDACRARKVRCARENQDDPQTACKHCITLGIPCTYDYQPKKRGPPNLYLRRLQEAAAAAAAAQASGNGSDSTDAASPNGNGKSPTQPPTIVPSQSPSSTFIEPSLSSLNSIQGPATGSIPPSRYPIAADTFHPHYPGMHTIPSMNRRMSESSVSSPLGSSARSMSSSSPSAAAAISPASADPFNTYPLYNWSAAYKQQSHLPVPPPSALPPSRITIDHTDSKMSHHETQLCSSSTSFLTSYILLLHVPRSFLPMERHTVRKLAQICHESSRHISVASYDPPQSIHVVIRYFDTVYHFCEGHDATSHASFGEAAHIAVTLHMHEETSYEGLDPIECEIRRRTFWLLFGADKSMSILLGRPICLRDEDCTLHFPKEVDDEYITPNGILPQPHGKTAIVSGLNYISRIFALLGEIQVRIRVDKRSPPQGHFATARLEESAGCLPSTELGGAGFRQATFAEVKDFFDNPNTSRANASNAFLVMQANLYVTQQLVRFVIEQYRDELISQLRSPEGPLSLEEHEQVVAEGREAVASDLLNVLHSIPIQSIATNGPSLVHKVRFVASTLLDAVRRAETAPASAARAHAYLWDFLSILSEIERNYLLDDDRDGGASGDSASVMLS
ncbi:quinate utilization pathway activator [Pyrrhoderma noxium]|uniref:Quinate utilization pathway activator n=1 Tax=Pyrrhoderma noxium TaxID=2282107 RepID=A0A286UBF8_9AGAM|nr:quinate utilization pathway activator [Pyrrhoderma noxium]